VCSRSVTTAAMRGLRLVTPSSRPVVSEEVMTASAPDCRSRWAFSCSRTEATIVASGASSRAVRVISTAASSRSGATITERARSTCASSRVRVREASPVTTV
jgi:hypothetical protein